MPPRGSLTGSSNLGELVERPVEIGFSRTWVRGAAAGIPIEGVLGARRNFRIDLVVELVEYALLQFEIVGKTRDLVGIFGGKFCLQPRRVPGF